MNIRKLVLGDEDALEQFLCQYTETSMFIHSNLKKVGLEYNGKTYQGEYFGSFTQDDDINGVLVQYWSGNVLFQSAEGRVLSELIDYFKDVVERPIAGVVGEEKQAQAVLAGLNLLDATFQANIVEKLYLLNLKDIIVPTHLPAAQYKMIEASEVERAILMRWIRDYEIEALGLHDTEELDVKIASRVDNIISSSSCWALEKDLQPLSLCGINAQLPDIVQIGPVWTPPEHRNKGYARTLVTQMLQKCNSEGVEKALLFTDNPAAIKAYEAIGFKEIGLYRLALLTR